MSKSIDIIIESKDSADKFQKVEELIFKGLKAGAVKVTLGRVDEKRSTQANRLMWRLLTDISSQIQWCGGYRSPEDWKDLITAVYKKQEILQGLDGGLVALGMRTSRMSKKDFTDLIEQIYAIGTERGVRWSADTNTDWNQYKEVSGESVDA